MIVSEQFDLEKYSLRLKAIKEGCIQFIYHISQAVTSYLLEFKVTVSMMSEFAVYNIISLHIDDMTLSVPSEVANMVSIP